ncbi:MAG: M6 family metalloprotease domain-containing protein [Deltaproteobacteria bacterium]|nr:M6 family metalloprotease domain-containing protein [Deltaproteobacteria bacterium]
MIACARFAIVLLILSISSTTCLAVPASPFPIDLPNRDGSAVPGRLFGDEFLLWAEDLAGYSLAWDDGCGAWFYAEIGPDGELVPTAHRAPHPDPARLGLEPHLRPATDLRRRTLDRRQALFPASPFPRLPDLPAGHRLVANLVLLVVFADQDTTFEPLDFDAVFNGPTGSVRSYYQDVSAGRWDLFSTLTGWIRLPQDAAHYAYNEYRWASPQDMAIHAVTQLEERGFDFTRFDRDGDGVIDALCVIHSGPGFETSGDVDHVHSHFYDLHWSDEVIVTSDGIVIPAYSTAPELGPDSETITRIGVAAHESAHFFGLPDLYDYDFDSAGIGLWGLMAAGPWAGPSQDGSAPTHFCAWSKIRLGMLAPLHIEVSASGLRLGPVEKAPEAIWIDAGMPAGQYFLLENRQRISLDRYLPGAGLLIYHIDDNRPDNNDEDHYLVDVEQADGLRELNRSAWELGDAGDPFPYQGNDAFTPTSSPSSEPYGVQGSSIRVLAIERDGEDLRFDALIDQSQGTLLGLKPTALFLRATAEQPRPSALVDLVCQGSDSLGWRAEGEAGWLGFVPDSGVAPGLVSIQVDSSDLDPGLYRSRLRFFVEEADASPVDLSVELLLSPRDPVIDFDPGRLDFVHGPGEPPPPVQIVRLTEEDQGPLEWWAEPEQAWIRVAPSGGSAPSDLQVEVVTDGLEFGAHQGCVLVGGRGARARELVVTLLQEPENWPPDAPEILAPARDVTVHESRPLVVVRNSSDPDGRVVEYEFEILRQESVEELVSSFRCEPDPGETTELHTPGELPSPHTYFLRARAVDDEGLAGAWSETRRFHRSSLPGCSCDWTGKDRADWLSWSLLGLILLCLHLGRHRRESG